MELKHKALLAAAIAIFFCSTLFFLKAKPSFALGDVWIDEKELGEMCIQQLVPAAKEGGSLTAEKNGKDTAGESAPPEKAAEAAQDAQKTQEAQPEAEAASPEEEQPVTVSGDPLVIIYHTHSSESYMPYAESNYHRVDEEGTVRDVGNVLENELKKKGINVIHDKTVHDRPSYNESYSRSLATIRSLVKKYPTAVYVIDLHRDAAASSATEGKYLTIDGQRVAKFGIVVGKANENYTELYSFAKKVSQKAESMYAGYGGPIIEKTYNYNGFISNKAILLEVGNNKNTIEEARACGKYFAEVMAAVIAEEQ